MTDSEGNKSPVLEALINMCDCNGRGTCRHDKLPTEQNPNTNFRLVKCDCMLGWTGMYTGLSTNKTCNAGHDASKLLSR